MAPKVMVCETGWLTTTICPHLRSGTVDAVARLIGKDAAVACVQEGDNIAGDAAVSIRDDTEGDRQP